jgi:ATP-dependent RNA helicase DDX54/DBP10
MKEIEGAPMDELIGFSTEIKVDDNQEDVSKKLKSSKKGGGFQAMGLSPPILKGIQKRGYKLPTPIQRKVNISEKIKLKL